MRIIKEVKPEDVNKETEVECWKCTSLIAYVQQDIKFSFRGESYVECPVCKCYIDV